MDAYNVIIQSIATVGFPIVCCLIMMKNNKDIQTIHKTEIDDMRKVIENNTLSITKLYDKIDRLLDVLNATK